MILKKIKMKTIIQGKFQNYHVYVYRAIYLIIYVPISDFIMPIYMIKYFFLPKLDKDNV